MKKLYFGIALLALGLCLNACKDKNSAESGGESGGGSESLTSLKIEPAELTMMAGESVRLDAVYAPKGAKVTLKWSSSDEEVVTVDSKGSVYALNDGEATITCEGGGKKATCAVKVTSWESQIQFTDCFLYDYGVDSTDIKYSTYTDDEWGKLKVVFADMNLLFFSEGFGYQNNGRLGGTEIGALADWTTKIMFAAVADNQDNAVFIKAMEGYNGVGWTLGAYYVDEKDTTHHAAPGSLDVADYVKNMKDVVAAVNEGSSAKYLNSIKLAAADVKGANVHIYEYETDEEGQGGYYTSYIPDGIFLKGSWIWTTGQPNTSSQYMKKIDYDELGIDYFKNDATHFGGLEIELQPDSTWKVVSDEVHFNKTIVYQYGVDPRNESVSMKAQPFFMPKKDDVEWNQMRQEIDNFRLSVKYKK